MKLNNHRKYSDITNTAEEYGGKFQSKTNCWSWTLLESRNLQDWYTKPTLELLKDVYIGSHNLELNNVPSDNFLLHCNKLILAFSVSLWGIFSTDYWRGWLYLTLFFSSSVWSTVSEGISDFTNFTYMVGFFLWKWLTHLNQICVF